MSTKAEAQLTQELRRREAYLAERRNRQWNSFSTGFTRKAWLS